MDILCLLYLFNSIKTQKIKLSIFLYGFMRSDNGVAVRVYGYYNVAGMYIKVLATGNDVTIGGRGYNAPHKIHRIRIRAK